MRRLTAVVAILVGTAAAGAPRAADDVDALRRELDALKEQVQRLQQRLRELEQAGAQAAAAERVQRLAEQAVEDKRAGEIDVGGAVRFQYVWRGNDANDRQVGGEIELDTVRINFDGEIRNILFSAEYRFYPAFGNSHFIHHGWVGYDFSEAWQARLGIQKVPFGILPYASHNFFFSSNYYLGLEDDYDAGLNWLYRRAPHNLQLAFFKNDEYAGGGGFNRYSYDPLNIVGRGVDAAGNPVSRTFDIEETNTVNLRYVYTQTHGEAASSQWGASLQGGQIYNSLTDDLGTHWAGALHLNGHYGRWNVMLQLSRYAIDPDAPATTVVSVAGNPVTLALDEGVIGTGAYSFEYTMPARAWTYIFNVAYELPVSWGPITGVQFYNDFSYVDKDDPRFDPTLQNVTGFSIAAGALFTYVDLVLAKNQPFTNIYQSAGGFGGVQFTQQNVPGTPYFTPTANDWNTRFNINVGYYF